MGHLKKSIFTEKHFTNKESTQPPPPKPRFRFEDEKIKPMKTEQNSESNISGLRSSFFILDFSFVF